MKFGIETESATNFPAANFPMGWIAFNVFLVALYVSFFHLCIGRVYMTCVLLGVAFAFAWWFACWTLRGNFLNRFEFLIYQVVGLDILLEGFNPVHSGFGFYFCALAFWSVFAAYRWLLPAKGVVTM